MKVQIVYRETARLVPYARNARTHSDEQVAQLAGSMREFGFTNPVLLDERDSIIAGHGRVLAARKLELSEVPCIVLPGLSDTQKRAYRLADNRIALNSGWDAEMLAVELQALAEGGVDASELGFGKTEIENILSAFQQDLGDVDETPWEGMPEFAPEPKAFRTIVVHCQDADAVEDFQRRMDQRLTTKTKYIYHPFKPREDRLAQAWVEGDDDGDESAVSDLHPDQGPG